MVFPETDLSHLLHKWRDETRSTIIGTGKALRKRNVGVQSKGGEGDYSRK